MPDDGNDTLEGANKPKPGSRPVRPPAPGVKPADVVPARAPRPSLQRTPQMPPKQPPRSVPETRQRPAEPAPIEAPAFVTADDGAGLGGPAGSGETSEDDLVAVPAPSAEMLMSSGLLHMSAPRGASSRQRSMTLQRTLIPILLTLALILPGAGVWLILHPAESELRVYGQRLLLYLVGGGVIFIILAIVNMIQVRSVRKARSRLR